MGGTYTQNIIKDVEDRLKETKEGVTIQVKPLITLEHPAFTESIFCTGSSEIIEYPDGSNCVEIDTLSTIKFVEA